MANILGWAIAILFGAGAVGALSTGSIGPTICAAIVALAALPPLWNDPGFVLAKVSRNVRWSAGVLAFLLFAASLAGNGAPVKAQAVSVAKARVAEAAAPSHTVVASTAKPAAAPAPANWHYDSSFDAMRNKTTYFACVTSTNELEFNFPYNGGASGQLCFRNSPQFGKDAYLMMDKGQFNCSFEGCTVHMKFDDGRILSVGATEASGGNTNTIFLHGYSKLESDMRHSKHLIVEAEYFQEGMQQLQFSVSGFDWKH